ncbi:MAG: ParB/RepB/Spo0J family partition protein [Marinosulfonomonas sp.]|nr:ParB/RepB/Spo0J family partition protein [Marinosulfonomonas sp.]
MADPKSEKRGLGRGLSALIGDVNGPDVHRNDTPVGQRVDGVIPIERIKPNPDQPRRQFDQKELDDLAASIHEKGILQPLIVRRNADNSGSYEIVAGERRWRAAQIARLHELPAIVREYTDEEVLEIAIIENIQRSDLNPVEEAVGYRQLMERFGHTQEKLAEALSKSRSYIANLLRLLQLPDDVLELLRDGRLSTGHARALITTDNPSELARHVVARGLSVRETERLAKAPKEPTKTEKVAKTKTKDADTRAMEAELTAELGMRVSIDHGPNGEGGRISINYRTLEDLDELCRNLSGM